MANLLTESDYSQVVSVESLESELSQVRAAAAGSLSGVFGPRSMTWQVNRESAFFSGRVAHYCCNLLILGWPLQSNSIRTPLLIRWADFIVPSAPYSQWCSERSIRALAQLAVCIIVTPA